MSEQQSSADSAQPVAWRWRSIFNDSSWCYGPVMPTAHDQYVTEPLYVRTEPQTAPSPDQACRDSDWLALSASEKACYHWPEDTDIHKQCRAAYIAGATDYAVPQTAIAGNFIPPIGTCAICKKPPSADCATCAFMKVQQSQAESVK
jgi:hypothetical protein